MSAHNPYLVSAQNISPLRRQHVAQPPTLSTASLNNAHSLGLAQAGQTSLSTTSLSSPFALHGAAAYPASPVATSSPMAPRGSPSYTTAYNPQQWGRIGGESSSSVGMSSAHLQMHGRHTSRTVAYAPRMTGPDGKLKLNGPARTCTDLYHRAHGLSSASILRRRCYPFARRHDLSRDRLLERNNAQ